MISVTEIKNNRHYKDDFFQYPKSMGNKIEARKENFDGSTYTSGRIKTEGRVHFRYGTVEARIKQPNMANGLWPAFRTLGTIGGG